MIPLQENLHHEIKQAEFIESGAIPLISTSNIYTQSDRETWEYIDNRGILLGLAHHLARVWLDCLQLLKLFYLALIYVVLQLPGTVLVRQRAPLHQVVHHLLQQAEEN